MRNNEKHSLSEISKVLKEAHTVLVFPHGSADGDALGSSVALCLGLRSIDKSSYVIIDEDNPENIQFIEGDCCCRDLDMIPEPDVCILMDNGAISRIYNRQDLFNKGKTTILIDHHKSSEPFLDYNYIDIDAAASAEIVYDLLNTIGVKLDHDMAEAIYVGIVTDTGRFQYSNTTKRTHQIVSELMDHGIDNNKISVEIYQSVSYEKVKLEGSIENTLRIEDNGRIAVAYMTKLMLEESGAKDEDTEGVVEMLRNLRGVEVAVFAKENDKDGVKVSMRAKHDFDVAAVSQEFGGGGHKKAAGFRCDGDIKEIISAVVNSIKEKMN